jgi:hypothetical protein
MSMHLPRAIPTLTLLVPVIAATGAGCAGTLQDKEAFLDFDAAGVGSMSSSSSGGSTCPDIPTTVFAPTCALSGCHTAKDMMGSLDLESPDPYQRLVGQMAHGGPGVIIDPGGDPQKSVLYLKLTPFPPFGSQMPLAGAKLDDASLACMANWISSNAGSASPQDAGWSDAPSSPGDDAGYTPPEAGDDGPGGGPVDSGGGGPDDSGGGDVEAGGPPTFTDVYTIIHADCLPCHSTGAGKTTGKLDMTTQATAYKDLVGVAAAGSACKGKGTRVVAGDSAKSLLVQKLNPTPTCGKQMPNGMPALSSTPIALITAWIDSGAPNN